MKLSGRFIRVAAGVAGLVALGWLAGCGNIFVPKQEVFVDAIAAPGIPKLSGQSYRLVARKSVVASQTAQLPVIAACINSALTSVGMFEAPEKVPSDIFIEVTYGVDAGSRIDPATRQTFLELSARANHGRTIDSSHEEELWNVRVAVAGIMGKIEGAMPLLTQVAATYASTDTRIETTVQILQNSPAVAAVREGALKILDGKTPHPAAGSGATAAATTAAPAAGASEVK